ncbi:MAG: DUF1836 domain-containing protein [Lachnospiraceae bacterium]|nr:DUF1836 domain-containing protein [Lachnospiraceae bacterium]
MTKETFTENSGNENISKEDYELAKKALEKEVRAFHCPSYHDLPDIGLYLEQVLGIINQSLQLISPEPTTGAMISNYIKAGVIPAPVKKRYYRKHLCYIIITTLLKPIFSLQQIAGFFELQKKTYPHEVAYTFFCHEFENALKEAFFFTGKPLPSIETKRTNETILVRSMVLAAVNRVYVEKQFQNK